MDYSLSKLVPHQSMIIISQLYFALKWLNGSNFHWIREAEFGWSKSSLQCDLEYFLCAIVEGLNDELQWPIVDRRAELSWEVYTLIVFVVVLELEMLSSFRL